MTKQQLTQLFDTKINTNDFAVNVSYHVRFDGKETVYASVAEGFFSDLVTRGLLDAEAAGYLSAYIYDTEQSVETATGELHDCITEAFEQYMDEETTDEDEDATSVEVEEVRE